MPSTCTCQSILTPLLLLQFLPLVVGGPQESFLWTSAASFSADSIPLKASFNNNNTSAEQGKVEGRMVFDEWIEEYWAGAMLFEWNDDDWACWPIDTSWYTEQDFFLNSAVCYYWYDDVLDWEEDEWEEDEWEEDEWEEEDDEEDKWDEDYCDYSENATDNLPPLQPVPMPLAKSPVSAQEEEQPLHENLTEWINLVHPYDNLQMEMPPDLSEEFQPYEQQPNFLVPKQLEAGEVSNIRWRDTGDIIGDDEIFAVGLDPQLLQEFQTYFETTGLIDIVQQFLYPSTTETAPIHDKTNQLWTLKDGHKWSAIRADHWRTDMVWFDPADEACYERLRHILRKGHFQTVVDAVADHLQLPNLTVHGLGAIFVGKFQASTDSFHIHRDIPESRGAFYNILVPIYLPSYSNASLHIGGQDDHLCAPINLKPHTATVIGSDSWHGTGECDYTAAQEFRLSMSIWVSEINDATLPVITTDGLSPWPLDNDTAWHQAQAHRNLTCQDAGRLSLQVRDLRADCAHVQHQCDTDWEGVRAQCAKTCRAYMAPEECLANLEALKLL